VTITGRTAAQHHASRAHDQRSALIDQRSLLALDPNTVLLCTAACARFTTMTALAQSREVFELLSKTLGFVPIIGENLKSAAELASKICEEIQASQHASLDAEQS
jgi:hypothetical protein